VNITKALHQQQNEINDYALYMALAHREKDKHNKEIFESIATEEHTHYLFWKQITHKEISPQQLLINCYMLLTYLFGTSFALKLIERRESGAEEFYRSLFESFPEAKEIYTQEMEHENKLINMLHDRKLLYAGAIVLGMNDALVELTGTLSGIAFAFDNTFIVGITGAIMGIAASLSMAGSAYLEAKENPDTSIKAEVYAAYTGFSYIFTTIVLVLPFFTFKTMYYSLALMFIAAFISIVMYNFYIAVAKEDSFIRRTLQMLFITFGVAIISFAIGYAVHHYFGINI